MKSTSGSRKKAGQKQSGQKEPVSREELITKIEEIKKRIEERVPKPGTILPKYDLVESKPGMQAIVGEHLREIETYPVLKPYASVTILYDDENHEHIYSVIEPPLSAEEKNTLAFIEQTLVDVIAIQIEGLRDQKAEKYLETKFDEILFDYNIQLEEDPKKKMMYYLKRDFLGYGKMDILMRDPMIEDISCDGPNIPIFLYHRKYESMRSNIVYEKDSELDSFVIKLAQLCGKHISIAEPILDATMPEGSRLQATLSKEVSSKGSTYTIRKFKESPFTPPDLVSFHSMSNEMVAFMWLAMQYGSSIMFAGGTASGKTTTLNAVSLFIPPQMKIVSIEDTRELNLPHPNWIPGITRTGFGPVSGAGGQAGEIDMFTLLKEALRQRPEYIIVGEVRGKEAYVMFQAMATGHSAYGTMHADSVESVIHRLESDPINVPRSLLEALDIVSVQIQTRIGGKRVRRCKQIVEIVGIDPHTREILTNEVFRWVPGKDEFKYSGLSYTLQKIMTEKGMSEADMAAEIGRRREIIDWMVLKKLKFFKDVAKIIASYYNEPEKTMDMVRKDLEMAKLHPPAEDARTVPAKPDAEQTPSAPAEKQPADESKPDAAASDIVKAQSKSLSEETKTGSKKRKGKTGSKKPVAAKKKPKQAPKKSTASQRPMKSIRCPKCKTAFKAAYGMVTCPGCGYTATLEKPKKNG